MGECNPVDIIIMALEGIQTLPVASIPHLDGRIMGSGGEKLRIVRECDRVDGVAMTLERLQALAAAAIPHFDSLVL
jgi:hypothetical protein